MILPPLYTTVNKIYTSAPPPPASQVENSNEIRKPIFDTIRPKCNINSHLFDESRG